MADSWAWLGVKFVGKIGAKIGVKMALNAALPGLGSVVDFSEALYDFYRGDTVGGLTNTLSGISDFVTLGMSSSAKEAMKGSAKNAVVQSAKETAKTVKKEATKRLVKNLEKNWRQER